MSRTLNLTPNFQYRCEQAFMKLPYAFSLKQFRECCRAEPNSEEWFKARDYLHSLARRGKIKTIPNEKRWIKI